jgi:hypothetical protein
MRPGARAVLAAAPTPADAAALTLTQLRALLKKAGRSRGIDTEATRLRDAFRAPQMRQLPLVEQAMGRQALALLGQLDAACAAADDLEHAVTESFNLHPDAGIITSFPGLGAIAGARVLAEIGDDRSRFQHAKGLKAYAYERCQQIRRGPPVTGTRHQHLSAAGELADDVAPPRLPSHLGAVGCVLDADAFGRVFVAWEYPVTVQAALLRLRSWRRA